MSLKEKDVPEDQSGNKGSVKTPPTLSSTYDCRDQALALVVKINRTRDKTELLDTFYVDKESGIATKVRTE